MIDSIFPMTYLKKAWFAKKLEIYFGKLIFLLHRAIRIVLNTMLPSFQSQFLDKSYVWLDQFSFQVSWVSTQRMKRWVHIYLQGLTWTSLQTRKSHQKWSWDANHLARNLKNTLWPHGCPDSWQPFCSISLHASNFYMILNFWPRVCLCGPRNHIWSIAI